VIAEPVIAELVEASKHPQVFYELIKTDERSNAKKPNGGFDTSTSSVTTGSTTTS